MKTLSSTALALALALVLAPALAGAAGYEVITVHPRDLALVHSTVASQHDAAATYFNPADLSQVKGVSVSAGFSLLDIQSDWKAPANSGVTGSASTKSPIVPPVAIYAAWGTQLAGRGFGVGLGVGNPGGGNVRYADDWQGRGRIIDVAQRIYGFYGSAGYELIPDRLRLGGTLTYYYLEEYLKQGIQPYPDAFAELSAKGGGWGFGAGLSGKPLDGVPLTLGLNYQHKVHMHATGNGRFTVPPALEGPTTQDQGVTHDVTFPNTFHVGAAYQVAKPVVVMLQYSYARWRVYQNDTFKGDKGVEIVVPRDYKDGHIIRGGVEWTATQAWTLRAGLMRDLSGYSSGAYSPTLPDSSIWAGALGAGYTLRPNLQLNGAFFYGVRDRVTTTNWKQSGGTTGTFPGVFDTRIWIASVGVTWSLPTK